VSGCATSPSSPKARPEPPKAIAPDEGDGRDRARGRSPSGSLAPLERLAPELAHAGEELRDIELRLREVGSDLRAFLASLEAEPDRLEPRRGGAGADLGRAAALPRADYDELLARAAEARDELAALDGGSTRRAAAEALARPRRGRRARASSARAAPRRDAFATAVADELRGVGMGEGEFRVELREREPGRPAPTRPSS
jgi:DNA repair ATPase RecN